MIRNQDPFILAGGYQYCKFFVADEASLHSESTPIGNYRISDCCNVIDGSVVYGHELSKRGRKGSQKKPRIASADVREDKEAVDQVDASVVGNEEVTSSPSSLEETQSLESRSKWAVVLKPTPELNLQATFHHTQIIFQMDANAILAKLAIWPGSVVLESGTGSGGLTAYLARAVFPTGHVHTMELSESRSEAVSAHFASKFPQYSPIVSFHTGNIYDNCAESVPLGLVDALILDVPEPWCAIDSAARALKPGGNCVLFCPSMTQISKAVQQVKADNRFLVVDVTEHMEVGYYVFADKREVKEPEDDGSDEKTSLHSVICDYSPLPSSPHTAYLLHIVRLGS